VVFHLPSKMKGEDMTYPEFPKIGLVRLKQILSPIGPIPVSKSTWWAGVKEGRFPQPIKLSPNTTVWRVEDIRSLFEVPDTYQSKE